jgi:hypothetical protein
MALIESAAALGAEKVTPDFSLIALHDREVDLMGGDGFGRLIALEPLFFHSHVSRRYRKPENIGRTAGLSVGDGFCQLPEFWRQQRHRRGDFCKGSQLPPVVGGV